MNAKPVCDGSMPVSGSTSELSLVSLVSNQDNSGVQKPRGSKACFPICEALDGLNSCRSSRVSATLSPEK